MRHLFSIVILLASTNLFSQVEARLPFSNIEYNSMSLRPLNLLDTDLAVRFYINIGSSVDRIITLQIDSIKRSPAKPDSVTALLIQGKIQYIGTLYEPSNDSSTFYYNEENILQQKVIESLDTLQAFDLWQIPSRAEITVTPHEPNSLYTIEIKSKDRYHTFYFNTLYPSKQESNTVYGRLESLIFSLFPEIEQQIVK